MNDLKILMDVIQETINTKGSCDLALFLRTGSISAFVPGELREKLLVMDYEALKVQVFSVIAHNAAKIAKQSRVKTNNSLINYIIKYGFNRVSNNGLPGDGHLMKEMEEILSNRVYDAYLCSALFNKLTIPEKEDSTSFDKSYCPEVAIYLDYDAEALIVEFQEAINTKERANLVNISLNNRRAELNRYHSLLAMRESLESQLAAVNTGIAVLEGNLFGTPDEKTNLRRN